MKRYTLGEEGKTRELAFRGRGWEGVLSHEKGESPVEGRRLGGELSLKLGDRMHRVEPVGEGLYRVDGQLVSIRLRSDLEARFEALGLGGRAEVGGKVELPMPGKVISVLVEEGQQVAEGEGLLIVEAMKMENEIKAPRAGVVRRLAVKAGDELEKGAPLLDIEAEETS